MYYPEAEDIENSRALESDDGNDVATKGIFFVDPAVRDFDNPDNLTFVHNDNRMPNHEGAARRGMVNSVSELTDPGLPGSDAGQRLSEQSKGPDGFPAALGVGPIDTRAAQALYERRAEFIVELRQLSSCPLAPYIRKAACERLYRLVGGTDRPLAEPTVTAVVQRVGSWSGQHFDQNEPDFFGTKADDDVALGELGDVVYGD